MRSARIRVLLAFAAAGALAGRTAGADQQKVQTFTLDNGIRVVVLSVPGSRNASIFTFLPLGLAADGSGQAQWSHLLEHLVIRTTVPAGSPQANGETLPDHMRLDFYGTVENWKEGLSHHAGWLRGRAFTAKGLETAKRDVLTESDAVARRLFAHKFAFAAWAQGCRHGQAHAALKADVARADLAEIQRYRDERLAVAARTVVCVVGGLDAEAVKSAAAEELGTIRSAAKPPQPVKLQHVDREMTWDLPARHLVLTWAMPAFDTQEHAALMVAGLALAQRLFGDAKLKQMTGLVLAGADLITPEGNFFYVSASLRPGVSFEAVRKSIDAHLGAIRTDARYSAAAALMGRQVAGTLRAPPDVAKVKAQAPARIPAAMVEANVALQWAMREFRYGRHRPALAARLAALDGRQFRKAVGTYLTAQKSACCTIRPRKPAGPAEQN